MEVVGRLRPACVPITATGRHRCLREDAGNTTRWIEVSRGEEALRFSRRAAGAYRVRLHNWLLGGRRCPDKKPRIDVDLGQAVLRRGGRLRLDIREHDCSPTRLNLEEMPTVAGDNTLDLHRFRSSTSSRNNRTSSSAIVGVDLEEILRDDDGRLTRLPSVALMSRAAAVPQLHHELETHLRRSQPVMPIAWAVAFPVLVKKSQVVGTFGVEKNGTQFGVPAVRVWAYSVGSKVTGPVGVKG